MLSSLLLTGTANLWPFLVALQAIPAVTSLIITPFLPETPRYLMIIKQKEEAAQKCTYIDRRQTGVKLLSSPGHGRSQEFLSEGAHCSWGAILTPEWLL